MIVRIREHQSLYGKLHIHHPASVVLQIEATGRIGMTVQHFLSHIDHIGQNHIFISRQTQNLGPFLFKHGTDLTVTRTESSSRQRLMFPRPCPRAVFIALIALEHIQRRHDQAVLTVRTQTKIDIKQDSGRRLHRQPTHHSTNQTGVIL